MKCASVLTFILLVGILTTANAAFSDCRKKYSGNLAIKGKQVGVTGQLHELGNVDAGFSPTSFAFYECNIKGYHRSPDEYGFLIAEGVSVSQVATAWPRNNAFATIKHEQGDYNGSNKEKINHQLVYANYFRPNGGDAQIDITFQGSPNKETSTGFSLRHAYFVNQKSNDGVQVGSVAIDSKTQNLGYDRLSLHDVVIETTDSLIQGQKTTNEQKIANDINTNSFKLSASAEQKYKTTKKIF